ncbi:MAG: protein kinase [Planctomycetes bacterium]|nr:protein kinase [Planctomycetota bacterium]
MPTPLPTSFGDRFDIEAALPETPFERTFRAHDKVLQRDVLLKLPAREAFAGWSAPIHDRILREARALAKLHHEHVAPIHWVEATPEGPLLVLDLPAGELLAERLQRSPLDVPETIALGVQIGQALAHVHLQGVVHRAVGPASIRLLANGRAQLGAFTFAKEFGQRGQGSSLAHAQLGAAVRPEHLPVYSAPEQLAGQTADPRADVFALGCTLFRCLAGQDAFPPGRAHGAPPDLRKLRPDVDRRLAEVIRKCLLFAKTARYATAQEVVEALQAVASGGVAGGGGRHGWLAAAAVALLAIGAWGASWLLAGDGAMAARGVDDDRSIRERQVRVYRPDYEGVHGLFIGIGKAYGRTDWPVLTNPPREVEAVVAQLRRNDEQWRVPGAIVTLPEHEATFEAILGQLERLERVGEEDAVLIYFAGHGARDEDSFGLVAADAQGTIVKGTGYVRRELLTSFTKRCRAKHVLIVLDCCHSGAVFDIGRGTGRDPEADAGPSPGAHRRQRFSREFLCSAGAGQPASDGAELSPFCLQLLAELGRPADPDRAYVAACHLAGRIGEAMEAGGRRGGMQLPAFQQNVRDQGSFVFRLPPK